MSDKCQYFQEEFELSLSKEQRRSSTLQVQLDKLQAKLDAANAAILRRFFFYAYVLLFLL